MTGGHGGLAFVNVFVDGVTGQIANYHFQYESNGYNYQDNDVLTPVSNYYMGGSGSGFAITVDTVNLPGGGITASHISNPGSGYLAPWNTIVGHTLTGSGSSVEFTVTVNSSGQVVALYPDPQGYGTNYQPGDHVGIPAIDGAGSGGYMVVGLVAGGLSALTGGYPTLNLSNNTLQTSNCSNLQSATSVVDGFQSVAPPNVGNPNFLTSPPTDVIGSYFASLPYGYTEPIPGIYYNGATAQTTGGEIAYSDYIGWQQKGNWDPNLMPHGVLSWAMPRFGMNNPP